MGGDEESDVSFLTGSFEGGGELAVAIDLQCPHREGHSFFDLIEKGGGGRGGEGLSSRGSVGGPELL